MNLDNQTHAPLPHLPPRKADSHKGDFGHALVIGGSRGMAGAVALTGQAALRSGAGLVTVAVPTLIQHIVANFSPCYMTHGLQKDGGHIGVANIRAIHGLAEKATAVALGPGLGRRRLLTILVNELYRWIKLPMVVDADALFALAEQPDTLENPCESRILTPHPGEFGRLVGKLPDAAQRIEAAAELALHDSTKRTVVVLKGHRTVVTDGVRYSINQTGNPGMATGGTGDVLTGVITALRCQGLAPFDAARLGVHVHGLAGDLAASDLGQVSLIASDLVDYLPMAFQAMDHT